MTSAARWGRAWRALLLAACVTAPVVVTAEPTLVLRVRDSYLPDVPLLVRVEVLEDGSPARGRWDDTAVLRVTSGDVTLDATAVDLRNGEGSALVTASGNGSFELTVDVGAMTVARTLRDLSDEPVQVVTGDLAGDETDWSGVLRLSDNVTVPTGHTLRVQPGTLVLLDGTPTGEDGVDLNVEGTMEVLGEESAPVTFTARDPGRPWGELDLSGADVTLSHTILSRGGSSPGVGHTGTGPTIRADDSTVWLDHCSITDLRGKAMNVDDCSLTMLRCHIARAIMGPEIDDSAVLLDSCHLSEMRGDDDNDGIYLHSQSEGEEMLLSDTVVAGVNDDGVDMLRGSATLESCIIRDVADKGVSVFDAVATISRTIIADCRIGVSEKGNDAALSRIDRCTIVGNELGLEAWDKFEDPDTPIEFEVSNSIIAGLALLETGFPEDQMRIRYSALAGAWPGEGNFTDDPMLVDPSSGDYRLQAGSPCIDSGDPDAPADPDGSRADCGALPWSGGEPAPRFVRGAVNGDEFVDVSDAVAVLLHLFGGRPAGCLDAADANDDGSVALGDAVYLLEHLFRAGPPPPAPATCGADPSADDLGCEEPRCE